MPYTVARVCDYVVVAEATTSSLVWAPSRRRCSTVVHARPANPTHSSWPSRDVILPSRRTLRVSTAVLVTSVVLSVLVPGAGSCGCRYSLSHVVHLQRRVWSLCGGWRRRLRPCRVHPAHSVHTCTYTAHAGKPAPRYTLPPLYPRHPHPPRGCRPTVVIVIRGDESSHPASTSWAHLTSRPQPGTTLRHYL